MYLTYNSLAHPTRQWNNPYSIKSPDAIVEFIPLNYSSVGDTNGLVYYLGTNAYTETFTNPSNNGRIISTSSGYIDIRSPAGATDRTLDGNTAGIWHANSQPNPFWQMYLPNGEMQAEKILLRASSAHGLLVPSRTTYLKGSIDGQSWTILHTMSGLSVPNNDSYIANITNIDYFRYFRFDGVTDFPSTLGEIEIYGKYKAI